MPARFSLPRLTRGNVLLSIIGSAILAFGLHNVHALSGVTEGGILGATLLFRHWWGVSPALSGLIMNAVCYLIGLKTMGAAFIAYSVISGGGFSLFYWLAEQFDPLLAAILGAVFVGVGVGLGVRAGGAPSGDDALAMSLSRVLHWPIERGYLITDLTVLALSVTYIDLPRLLCSLLTVLLSGKIIGIVQRGLRPSS